jgi:hypothetical protein
VNSEVREETYPLEEVDSNILSEGPKTLFKASSESEY